jgi:hypothetical protein
MVNNNPAIEKGATLALNVRKRATVLSVNSRL